MRRKPQAAGVIGDVAVMRTCRFEAYTRLWGAPTAQHVSWASMHVRAQQALGFSCQHRTAKAVNILPPTQSTEHHPVVC